MRRNSVKLYKASKEFEDEVSESSKDAYDYVFSQYRNLIKKLYPEVDISKITPKIAIEMGMKGDLESPPEVVAKPAKESDWSTIEVNVTEAILRSPNL